MEAEGFVFAHHLLLFQLKVQYVRILNQNIQKPLAQCFIFLSIVYLQYPKCFPRICKFREILNSACHDPVYVTTVSCLCYQLKELLMKDTLTHTDL